MPLSAQSITFSYGMGTPVLRAVSTSLSPGRVTAILGPNGAGKSTLVRLLMGLAAPQSGRATLDDADVRSLPRPIRARRLVYVPQHTSLAFAFSVRAVVAMGHYACGESGGSSRLAAEAMERLEVADLADRPFGELSAGQRQRVTLARALAQISLPAPPGTRAFLADEPVASMDPRHALACLGLFRALADRQGIAIGIVLHDLGAALRFADDALVLDASGTVAAAGPTPETVTGRVMGSVFGVPFREVRDGARAVALLPTQPAERSSATP